jgi:hypothetical protein
VWLVALAHELVGVRRPLIADNAFLGGVVRLVCASRTDDERRDDQEWPWAVRREFLVGAAQLHEFVVEAFGDELLESLADALDPIIESLEIGGDPDLHGRLYAPAYAVHDERHQLLIVVDPEDVSKVLEGPVCAPGPLVVQDVV